MLKKLYFYSVVLSVLGITSAFAQVSQTALFYNAANSGSLAQVRALMQQGFDLNAEDVNGNTALCVAQRSGNRRAYSTLIRAGASTSVPCFQGSAAASNTSSGIRLNGGLGDSQYAEQTIESTGGVWGASYTVGLIGLLIGGGVVAALAAGGGGSGGSSPGSVIYNDADIVNATIPSCLGGSWENHNGTYVCVCPVGKSLKNGACVETAETYKTADINHTGVTEITGPDDTLTVELGAKVVNSGIVFGTTSSTAVDMVALKANGFSEKAYSGDLLPETKLSSAAASVATNNGEITLTQTSSGGQLFGIQALAGALAYNGSNGVITINAHNSYAAYAMYSEEISDGMTNNGTVNVNAYQFADIVHGMYSPNRSTVNTGDINLVITNPVFNPDLSGIVSGMYGSNARNRGTITLRRGEAVMPGSIPANSNLNVYAMYTTEGGSSENQQPGLISMDITGTPFYSYGMYANKGADHVTNDGKIEIFGRMEHYLSAGIGGTYAMRFTGGYGTMTNNGLLTTSYYNPQTEETEYLTITGDAYLSMMRGFSGTVTNNSLVDIYVLNNASCCSIVTLEAMDVEKNGEGDGIVNNAEVRINALAGTSSSVKEGSKIFALFGGEQATATNYGRIIINTELDNMDVYAMRAKEVENAQYASISITGYGNNTNLHGVKSVEDGTAAANAGTVTIIHHGSGSMFGAGGYNYESGSVSLLADPTDDGEVYMAVTGFQGSNNDSNISIVLKKGSAAFTYDPDEAVPPTAVGIVNGYDPAIVDSSLKNEFTSITNTKDVNITLAERTQSFYGSLVGMLMDKADAANNITNQGVVRIDASTYTVSDAPLEGDVWGIYAPTTQITNVTGAKVEILTNGAGRVLGIANYASLYSGEKVPQIYKINNQGTLSIKAVNTVHNPVGTALINLDATTTVVPFDIIGIATNSFAVNSGDILLDISGGAKVAGMVAYDGGMAINTGMIEFRGDASNFVALYGTGKRVLEYTTISEEEEETEQGGKKKVKVTTEEKYEQYSTIYNWGRIKINGEMNTEYNDSSVVVDNALIAPVKAGKTQANQIVTTTTTREGEDPEETVDYSDYVAPKTTSNALVLNEGMNYSSEKGGSFEAPGQLISGSVIGGLSNVLGDNQTSYVADGFGEGAVIGNGDDSLLSVSSASYMFDAEFQHNQNNVNGLDIVMNMKSFDEMTNNQSLAQFLTANYATGHNIAFFDMLKATSNATEFHSTLNKLIGQNVLSKFNYEDLTAMRDLNFAMNEYMFNAKKDAPVFGYVGTVDNFSFKASDRSASQYGLVNHFVSSHLHVGYGVAFTNLRTQGDDHNSRQDTMMQIFAPIGYDAHGLMMISTPRFGYAKGNYTRQGLDGTYKGQIEKRIFGVMNEARYPLNFGFATLEPAVEFNALGYVQSGREDDKAYSLNIQKDTTVSLEAGVGLYAKKAFGDWNVRTGIMCYHEFGNPYDVQVGINGMEGSFKLTDEKADKNRQLAVFDLSYDVNGMSVYGNVKHWIQNDTQTMFKMGMKIHF